MVLMALYTFQVMITLDQMQPAGTSTSFAVEEVTAASKKAALAEIQRSAEDLHINIYKIQPDAHDSYRSRVLFVFVGDVTAFYEHGGYAYPTFSAADQKTQVRPASAINTEDVRGSYAASANATQLESIGARLRAAGIQTRQEENSLLSALVYSLGQGSMAAPLVIVAATLIVAIGYDTSRNRKIHAIKTLHGYGRAPILCSELTDFGAVSLFGLIALALLGLPVLFWYTHGNQLGRFLSVLLGGEGYLLLFCVLSLLVLGGAASLRDSIPEVIKGQGAVIRDGVLAAVVQVVVLAVMFGTASGALNRIEAVRHTEDQLGRWSSLPSAYVLRLLVHRHHADDVEEAPKLLRIIQDMDKQGQVLLVDHSVQEVQQVTGQSSSASYELGGSRSMLVNPRYLGIETVLDTAGKPLHVGEQPEGTFTLLVPDSYDGNIQELKDTYIDRFTQICSTPVNACTSAPIQGKVIRIKSGQALATFHGTQFMPAEDQQDLTVTDPVLAVVSPSAGVPGAIDYLSYASRAEVLFFDADGLDRRLTQAGIREGYQGIDNAADSVAVTLSMTKREQRGDVLGLLVGAFATLLSTLVCTSVYSQKRRRASFVEMIHGYGFLRRHASFFSTELALAVSGLLIAAMLGHMNRPRDAGLAAVLLVLGSLCTLLAVAGYESTLRAEDIKRP
ncbi:hypothetical protein BOCO_0824 [Bombiscardovia coagulans]|uniref:Uncharacterized protein n=2 Tax=Bombiscardovia coagulans TaxID=686666 RepID=A0A261ETY7_9BIFI|nr:hypothetical protein BOCO_0824 [Bombiscardovia coagulans]